MLVSQSVNKHIQHGFLKGAVFPLFSSSFSSFLIPSWLEYSNHVPIFFLASSSLLRLISVQSYTKLHHTRKTLSPLHYAQVRPAWLQVVILFFSNSPFQFQDQSCNSH